MSQHAYENSAYAECGNDRSLEKPKENSRTSITRYVILFSILIAVCLVISISGLIIAVHLSLRNEDTHPTTPAAYQQNGAEPSMEHLQAKLEELEIQNRKLESVNSNLSVFIDNSQEALWMAVNKSQEASRVALNKSQETMRVALNTSQETLRVSINKSQETLWAALNKSQETLRVSINQNTEQQQQFKVSLTDRIQSLNDLVESHHKVQGL